VLRAFKFQELAKGVNRFADNLSTDFVDWEKDNDNCINSVAQVNQLHF